MFVVVRPWRNLVASMPWIEISWRVGVSLVVPEGGGWGGSVEYGRRRQGEHMYGMRTRGGMAMATVPIPQEQLAVRIEERRGEDRRGEFRGGELAVMWGGDVVRGDMI